MLDHNLVLKSDELFLVGNISTDGSGERATGLYLRDTRYLSQFRVTLNRGRLDCLAARLHSPIHATVMTANRLLTLPDGEVLLPLTVLVEEHVTLDTGLRVTFGLQNFTRRHQPLTLSFELASDFRDLFDIRGFPRVARGRLHAPQIGRQEIVLGYQGVDGLLAETRVSFDREPTVSLLCSPTGTTEGLVPFLPRLDDVAWEPAPSELPGVLVTFETALAPGERWELQTAITPVPADGTAISAVPTVFGQALLSQASITTDNPYLDQLMARSRADLSELQTSFPEGSLPAAGIPWYVAPFGRDSLITGLQTLHLSPSQAAGTLRVLAALQGNRIEPRRDEEPGKILHEVRYGEMRRTGEIPHTPYYGTVDATPLFAWLFAETVAWTGDAGLYHDLLPNVRRALEWIERYGDLDGDGFVEYQYDGGSGVGRIANQVWKDSYDSLNHADGRPVSGAIAAVEVQGYVFAAYRRLADVAEAHGDPVWAAELRDKAEAMRQRIEEVFWLTPDGFYAQALDGDKTPVRAIASNPGHLLCCGLPSPERAALVAERLRQHDLDSGWGIRTLSAMAPTYNPMSYHNGSVWPHDNSLIVAGLYRYGHAAFAHAIARALVDAGRSDPQNRLPELYCGFPRTEAGADAPVAYPVSCSPQAWAAGAIPLILRSMLGLTVDVAQGRLLVAPALPDWLGTVTVRDVHVLGHHGSLTVRRAGYEYTVEAEDLPVAVAANSHLMSAGVEVGVGFPRI